MGVEVLQWAKDVDKVRFVRRNAKQELELYEKLNADRRLQLDKDEARWAEVARLEEERQREEERLMKIRKQIARKLIDHVGIWDKPRPISGFSFFFSERAIWLATKTGRGENAALADPLAVGRRWSRGFLSSKTKRPKTMSWFWTDHEVFLVF